MHNFEEIYKNLDGDFENERSKRKEKKLIWWILAKTNNS